MKHNEKLLIASVICGMACILTGAVSFFCFYQQWPFFHYDLANDELKGCWVGRGGLLLSAILVSLVAMLTSLLLLAIYERAKIQRPTVVWNGGLFLFVQLVMGLCMLPIWEDIIGFVPLASGVYFFGFVQGLTLCFAKGEKSNADTSS